MVQLEISSISRFDPSFNVNRWLAVQRRGSNSINSVSELHTYFIMIKKVRYRIYALTSRIHFIVAAKRTLTPCQTKVNLFTGLKSYKFSNLLLSNSLREEQKCFAFFILKIKTIETARRQSLSSKELSFCHKLKFYNPYICATWWGKSVRFQT